MTVHEAARRGFEREAQAYDRGRPEYPAAAIDYLADQLGLRPGRIVADVGAGTGKLTQALEHTGAELVAVEPVAAMRELLARALPAARVLDATAEGLPLAGGSIDAIVVGQAFHWFDGPRALREFHRVLCPEGRLALVWNRRRYEQPLHAAIEEIIAPYRGATPSHRSGQWRGALEATDLFEPIGERVLPFVHVLSREQLVDRVASTSFIGALDEREQAAVLARVRGIAHSDTVELGYECEVSVFGRLAARRGGSRR